VREECEWVMMGMVNIGAILEHSRALSIIRRAVTTVQASPATSKADKVASTMVDKYPIPFKLMVQLTFAMLSHVLKHPTPTPSPSAHSTLNLYLTFSLTFLATLSKHTAVLTVLELSIPWDELALLFLATSWPLRTLTRLEIRNGQ